MPARSAIAAFLLGLLVPSIDAQPGPIKPVLSLGPNDKVVVRLNEKSEGLAAVDFSPDGKLLVMAGAGRDILLWDVASNQAVRRLTGHKGFVRTARFSPDGKLIAAAGDDSEVILWDVATGKEVRRIGKHPQNLRAAVFSPDGKTIASAGFDEHIGLWDVASGKQLQWFRAHPRVAYGISFSPDGRFLISGGDKESTIRMWSTATGKQVRSWDGHLPCVHAVAYSPDGRLIASGGEDGVARIWETLTGREVRRFEGHKSGVTKVAFSPDGRILATTSHNESIHVWDITAGKEIRRCGNHNGWVWGLAFAPDGRTVISSGNDGVAVRWEVGVIERKPVVRLSSAQLEEGWRDLASADAKVAYEAAIRLATGSADNLLPFLKERVRPVKAKVDTETIKKWIRNLDSGTYRVREVASRDLANLGDEAGPELRHALNAGAPSEARERILVLLGRLESGDLPPETLRSLRALHLTELFGTPSVQLLEELAKGIPGDRLTREAQAALVRIKSKPVK